jgi:transposase
VGLCCLRQQIAEQAQTLLADHPDSRRIMTVPGIGPTNALTIIAEVVRTILCRGQVAD